METEQLLEQMLNEIKTMNQRMDHLEHAVQEVKESIKHVNRRVADTELLLHVIKSVKQ